MRKIKHKFKVVNKENLREIYISGDIVDDTWKGWSYSDDVETFPEDIRNLLEGAEDVTVYINSGGGDLFAGMAICNLLQRHPYKTKAVIDGLAASAASIIAFGCDEIEMPSNAYLMIHKPAVMLYGNSDTLLKWAETLEELQGGILNTYMVKANEGITEERVNNLINAETWFTGKSASEFFNIRITDRKEVETENIGNMVMNYCNTPDIFKENTEDESKLEQMKNELEMALIY